VSCVPGGVLLVALELVPYSSALSSLEHDMSDLYLGKRLEGAGTTRDAV
jgi:hypothetical protein